MHQLEKDFVDTVINSFAVYGYSQQVIKDIIDVANCVEWARANNLKKTSVRKLTEKDEGKYLYYSSGSLVGQVESVDTIDDGTEYWRPRVDVRWPFSALGFSCYHEDEVFYIGESIDTVEPDPYVPHKPRSLFEDRPWAKFADSKETFTHSMDVLYSVAENPKDYKEWKARRAIREAREELNNALDMAEDALNTGKGYNLHDRYS